MKPEEPEYHLVRTEEELDKLTSREEAVHFFHHNMKPYEDEPADVNRALDHLFAHGGYMVLAMEDGGIQGGVAMLQTGMSGYIPETILVFIGVRPEARNQGIGGRLMERALAEAPGDVKLHVEPDNPARRLYERQGFKHLYNEMRLKR